MFFILICLKFLIFAVRFECFCIYLKLTITMARMIIDIPKEMLLDTEQELVIRIVKGSGAQWNVSLDNRPQAETFDSPILPDKTTDKSQSVLCPVENSEDAGQGSMLFEYTSTLIQDVEERGQLRLSEIYQSSMNSFRSYLDGLDIAICQLNQNLMLDYEHAMRRQGLAPNTTSFYLRALKAIYNRAVRDGVVTDCKPFALVFTGQGKTKKRAAPYKILKKIARAEPHNETLERARDFFLFSFYTRGMSFVDMAYLKRSDIKKGYLTYKRQKTKQTIKIKWRPEMQDIVDRHPSLDGVHLLGILNANLNTPLRKQYHSKQVCVNLGLKKLEKMLHLNMHLTMYVARHSWATLARDLNIPISVISEGMGHHSESTTQIYLKSIDMELIDKSNDVIIAAIQGLKLKRRGKKRIVST